MVFAVNFRRPVPACSIAPPFVLPERLMTRLVVSPVPVYWRIEVMAVAAPDGVPLIRIWLPAPRLLVRDPAFPMLETRRFPPSMEVSPVYVFCAVRTTNPVLLAAL